MSRLGGDVRYGGGGGGVHELQGVPGGFSKPKLQVPPVASLNEACVQSHTAKS